MIVFDCPGCKTKLQAADEHAGATIQCPHCQQLAVVPASSNDTAVTATPSAPPQPPPTAVEKDDPRSDRRRRDKDDDDDDEDRRRDRDRDDRDDERGRRRRPAPPAPSRGMSGVTITLIVLGVCACVIVPLLIALLVPAVQKVREAAARQQSTNNLQQIVLGFHSFHDVNKRLPFNGTRNAVANDAASGSWGFQILPYIEQQNMFVTADRNAGIMTYMCPGRGRPNVEMGGGAWSDYFFNNYVNNPELASQPNAPDKRRTLVGITDGASNTIMVGHGNIATSQYGMFNGVTLSTTVMNGGTGGTMRSGNNGATSPGGVFLQRDSLNPPLVGSWGGPFPQGALMGMGDGTVRLFPYSTGNFNIFLTPTGNEFAILPDM